MPRPQPIMLMIRQLDLGGTERQLAEIAKNLDRDRFEPHVACFRTEGLCGQELQAAGLPIVQFSVRSMLSVSAFASARQLGRYLSRHSIRLIHCFDVPADIWGVFAARWFRAPVVLSSQRAHRSLTPGSPRTLLRLTDRLVDAVVVNCEAMRRHLIEDEKVPASLTRLCYNGVDTSRFQPGPRRRPPELREASLVIGAACEIRREKGLSTLLEAFARVRGLRDGMKLLLVGDGPYLPDLCRRARELGIEEDLVTLPKALRVEEWLRVFDIFVLPSLSEALSNSLMEAMGSGCAVVASDVGGNPELVTPERNGMLFPAGNAAGLAQCLERLIRSECLRRQLAEHSVQLIRERFSVRASVEQMQSIYASFLK